MRARRNERLWAIEAIDTGRLVFRKPRVYDSEPRSTFLGLFAVLTLSLSFFLSL